MNTDLKSNLLLGGSCLAAISATACIFELLSGSPDYGIGITVAILALTGPLTVWFFLAAVSAARAAQK